MGKAFGNSWIKLASVLLAVGTVLCLGSDLLMFFNENISWEGILVSQSILAGVLYPVFGVGLIAYQKRFGNLALVTGILTILTGLAFLSVVLALPGLVLLYRAYEHGANQPADSTLIN